MDQQTHEWPSNSTWLILITYIAWNPTSMDICPARLFICLLPTFGHSFCTRIPTWTKQSSTCGFLCFFGDRRRIGLLWVRPSPRNFTGSIPERKRGDNSLTTELFIILIYIYIHLHVLSKTVSKKNMQIAVNIYKITLNHLKQLEPPGSNSRLRSLRASSVSSRGKWWSTAPSQRGLLVDPTWNGYYGYMDILFIKVGY